VVHAAPSLRKASARGFVQSPSAPLVMGIGGESHVFPVVGRGNATRIGGLLSRGFDAAISLFTLIPLTGIPGL